MEVYLLLSAPHPTSALTLEFIFERRLATGNYLSLFFMILCPEVPFVLWKQRLRRLRPGVVINLSLLVLRQVENV